MSGDWSSVAPPLPISNRAVKHASADDTGVERPWDNMSLPGFVRNMAREFISHCRIFFPQKMDGLPINSAALHFKINQIAQEEGYQSNKLSQIYFQLPVKDGEGITFLESAGQCILEASTLVDQTYPNLPRNILVAKKFKLLSKLLNLKATQLLEN